MDRNRFSAIAHRNHAFSNPISEAKINQLLPMLDLHRGQTVIDIGVAAANPFLAADVLEMGQRHIRLWVVSVPQ